MDIGLDNLRELLEDFLGNSGGRRGREREQRRQAARDDEPLDEASGGAEPGSAAGDDQTDTSPESESREGTGSDDSTFDPDELDEDEVVDELYHRIENLESELDEKGSRLGTIQDSQEQVAEQVDEVNDRVRQLVGIYDKLTDDVNPFTGEGEQEGGFGIFGDDEEESGFASSGADLEEDDEETVTFDDLKGVIEEAAEASARERAAEEDGDGTRISFDEEEAVVDGEADTESDDDTRVEVQPTESVDEPAEEDDESDGDVTLDSLAHTYATDVLVFEWLTDLVRTAGPAATLRAISYYEEIGWIDEEVKDHLESVLSGPDLDIHVDPASTPDELTAEDHADSYTYIMKLSEVHETEREVEP